MSRRQTAGQNSYTRVGNKSLEIVAKLKCLGMTVTNKNCIHEEQGARHAARTGEMISTFKIGLGNLKGRNLGVVKRLISK
jgi:hypothetical protein